MPQPESKPPEFANSDDWYRWKGVKPPTHDQHGLSDEDIRKLTKEQLANHQCKWQQRGTLLHCEAGEFGHGYSIGPDKILTGQDGNRPILADKIVQISK